MLTPSSMARPVVKTRPLTAALDDVHVIPDLNGIFTIKLFVVVVQSIVGEEVELRSRYLGRPVSYADGNEAETRGGSTAPCTTRENDWLTVTRVSARTMTVTIPEQDERTTFSAVLMLSANP